MDTQKSLTITFEVPALLHPIYCDLILRGMLNPRILIDTDEASKALETLLMKYAKDGAKEEQAAALLRKAEELTPASPEPVSEWDKVLGKDFANTQLGRDMEEARKAGMTLEDYCEFQEMQELNKKFL